MSTFIVFGDSIAYGAWDSEGGWVQRLRRFLDSADSGDIVYNLGISGDTAGGVLERMNAEAAGRIDSEYSTLIIVAVGINDSYLLNGEPHVEESVFEQNLKGIIETAKSLGSDVAFLGLMPVDESATCPTQWNHSVSYYNNRIEEYDAIIRNLCEETGTPFIPLFDEWMEKDYSKFLEDGVHPNSEGHERIFEKVSSFLAERNLH